MLDVNSSQQYSNDSYREPSFIIRIGMDKCDGKWCERFYFDMGDSRFHEIRFAEDVISEHNKVFKDHGRVAFGRFGELEDWSREALDVRPSGGSADYIQIAHN